MMARDVTGQTRAGNPAVMSDETVAFAPSLEECDVVYVVRPGETNEALRYSLRSLINLPHRRIYVAGYCPSWVTGVIPIYRDQRNQSDQENSNANLLQATLDPDLSDDFIFMNDDFMVMEPLQALKPMHQGSLDARIRAYQAGNRMHQAYSLITTKRALVGLGWSSDGLLSYELHMPMLLNKQKVWRIFDYWLNYRHYPLFAMRPRTLYGNAYQLNGDLTSDAKGATEPQLGFISTTTGFSGPDAAAVKSRHSSPSPHEALPGAASRSRDRLSLT